MKFYKLRSSAKDLGRVPQDNGILGDYNVMGRYSMNMVRHSQFPVEGLEIPEGIILHHQAKFTDYCNFAFITFPFMAISQKFFSIMKTFNIPDWKSKKIVVVKRTKTIDYVFFYSNYIHYNGLNFEKTKFAFEDFDKKTKEEIQINSSEEYEKLNREVRRGFIRIIEPPIFNLTSTEYDLIRLPKCCLLTQYLVSERLRNALLEANLTGVDFELFNEKLVNVIYEKDLT